MVNFLMLLLFLDLGNHPKKTVEKNGMKVSWQIQRNRVYFEMKAPTKGWLAIGLHTENQLQGNNLIMAAMENNTLRIEDQYIQAIGDHQKITVLGGQNALLDTKGKQTTGETSIVFSLPLKAVDAFHQNLEKGKTYYLLMAYSSENDFKHHSRMRTTISITL